MRPCHESACASSSSASARSTQWTHRGKRVRSLRSRRSSSSMVCSASFCSPRASLVSCVFSHESPMSAMSELRHT
eukprot:4442980-Prymnesium_polylepis.1